MKDKLLAIIPARISSRRLPGKNFIDWFGRPIIESVVEEVEKSQLFKEIIISTDASSLSELPKNISKFGYLRPMKVVKYGTTVDEICLDVIKRREKFNDYYDYICCIYPTAYAVRAEDLKIAYEAMKVPLIYLNKNGGEEELETNFVCSVGMLNHVRHNLKYSSDNGGFYFARTKAFLDEETVIGAKAIPYKLDMVDINTYEDYIDAMAHRLSMTDHLKRDCKCGI